MSHNVPLGKKVGLTEAQIAAAQGDDYMSSPTSTSGRRRRCAGPTRSPR